MTRLLVLNFFPAFAPSTSGGEQRYFHLYRHLSREFDVTLLSPTYGDRQYEVVEHGSSFREHRVPKDAVHDRLHLALADADVGAECSAVVVALAAGSDTAYGRMVELLVPEADVVVHECPFTFPYDRSSGSDGKPRVYNSYNVEAALMAQMLGGPRASRLVDFVGALEGALLERADLVFATSDKERRQFVARYGTPAGKIRLAPNGFEPAPDDNAPAREPGSGPTGVLFMGSAHPPNVEAAEFILEHLAPRLPDTRFEILGSVCRQLGAAPANVNLHGLVGEAEKHALLGSGLIALNPMSAGAGTNLKMLDYMAAAAPILTTPIGARGLELVDQEHARVVQIGDFAAAVRELQADVSLRERLGRNAATLARRRYAWAAIAHAVAGELRGLVAPAATAPGAPARPRLPLVLVLNDFAVSDPRAGGEVRINRLWRGLAGRFDVVLLCFTDAPQPRTTELAQGVVEIAVPKTPAHQRDELLRNAGQMASANDVVASWHCAANPAFVEQFRRHVARAALLVFEHPYLAPMLAHLPRPIPVVYASLNVETQLKGAILAERADAAELLARVAEVESELLERAQLVVCVSEDDRASFALAGAARPGLVIRNGVDCGQYAPLASGKALREVIGERPAVVFLGSAHLPNIEAARFVVAVLAPALPDAVFLLVGSCCYALAGLPVPANVLLFGALPEDQKNSLLANADLAVNPMFSGGGSSLKMAEFLAAGLPVVTTRMGMRGFELEPGVHVLPAEHGDFVGCVRTLLQDGAQQARLRERAAEYARAHLDWRQLSASLGDALARLVERAGATHPRKPRLLVVTYRYTAIPAGGAETFLQAMLKELHALGHYEIDLACPAVQSIGNRWHFGASYEPVADAGGPPPPFLAQLLRFGLDPVDDAAMFAGSRRLFQVWLAEDLEQARGFLPQYGDVTLMGGWYLPECDGHGTRRWTGACAEIYVPRGAGSLVTLAGSCPGSKNVEVSVSGRPAERRKVGGRFELAIDIDEERHQIVRLTLDRVTCIDSDPRSLGLCVDAVRLRRRVGSDYPVDLATDFGTVLRRDAPDRWVASLIDAAQSRSAPDDALFVRGRGPHSSSLVAWLSQHVGEYDVMLCQGVPFATSVLGVEHANAAKVPCVVLPHFHMDDKYYHWQDYYLAFRQAQRVIAAPDISKGRFFDRIGARAVVLPGGGANPAEFVQDDARARRFRELHATGRPFVLALGRKAGAKQWQRIVAAVEQVNRSAHRLDLVMIGPDDDQIAVTSPHVRYYGEQPRELVLGALAACLCLASMSDSESFGIVLVEAWLSSRPVIALGRSPAFAELVEEGVDGFLVDTEAELAERMARYLQDPALADAHGERGRTKAADYTWAALARGFDRCLTELVEESAG